MAALRDELVIPLRDVLERDFVAEDDAMLRDLEPDLLDPRRLEEIRSLMNRGSDRSRDLLRRAHRESPTSIGLDAADFQMLIVRVEKIRRLCEVMAFQMYYGEIEGW